MSLKAIGQEFNRTYLTSINVGDVGAFNSATVSILLRGDSARKQFITGFSFTWRVGVAADVGPNGFTQVLLAENFQHSGDSNIPVFPDVIGTTRFYYADNAGFFQNKLEVQFQEPFKLIEGVLYSMVGIITPSVTPITATISAFFTTFGFDQSHFEQKPFYGKPR